MLIRVGPVPVPNPRPETGYCVSADDYRFWTHCAAFSVAAGRTITVEPSTNASELELCMQILNGALPTLIWQVGGVALHGAALRIGNMGVIVVGDKGVGKSTLAGILYRRGHLVAADDVSGIRLDPEPTLLPAYPRLRMTAASLAAVRGEPPGQAAQEPWTEATPKFRMDVTDRFCSAKVALHAVYVLVRGSRVAIEPLEPGAATGELLHHSMAVKATAPAYLDRLARLVTQVPVKRLVRDGDLNNLPRLAAAVESDVHRAPAGAPVPTSTA